MLQEILSTSCIIVEGEVEGDFRVREIWRALRGMVCRVSFTTGLLGTFTMLCVLQGVGMVCKLSQAHLAWG